MIKVEINIADMTRIQNKLDKLKPFYRKSAMKEGMFNAAAIVVSELKTRTMRKGGVLNVRSNALRNSIGSKISSSWRGIEAIIGSGVGIGSKRMPYANILEKGGIIKAKNPSGYLTIPIRAGSKEAINMGLWQNKKGNTKRRISYSSKVITFRKVKQVTIPATKYLSIAAANSTKRVIDTIMTSIRKVMVN